MTSRERVLAVLSGQPVDRPPVMCAGGMMTMACTEVMAETGAGWPESHGDAELMARLVSAFQQAAGFDNVGVPFCMTVEAEALGSQVNYGSDSVQPRVSREVLTSAGDWRDLNSDHGRARVPVVLEALTRLKAGLPDMAAVGNVVGPFSLAGSVVSPDRLLREVVRRPDEVRALLAWLTDWLERYGIAQVEAGAEVMAIAEPSATGEILGQQGFAAFAAPYLRRLTEALRRAGAKVILHICGDATDLGEALGSLGADAVSVDGMVNLRWLKELVGPVPVMGNVSAFTLARDRPAAVAERGRRALAQGADILAPACGVVPTTPLANLRAFAQAAIQECRGG
ncbi:MAG: uroporphyrinogen decarboxylase family protein [Armatimonadota bacterium]